MLVICNDIYGLIVSTESLSKFVGMVRLPDGHSGNRTITCLHSNLSFLSMSAMLNYVTSFILYIGMKLCSLPFKAR